MVKYGINEIIKDIEDLRDVKQPREVGANAPHWGERAYAGAPAYLPTQGRDWLDAELNKHKCGLKHWCPKKCYSEKCSTCIELQIIFCRNGFVSCPLKEVV